MLVRSTRSQRPYEPWFHCSALQSVQLESANVNASIRLLVLGTLALLIMSGTASADDALTCRFAGTASIDDAEVPDGTVVAAIIGDRVYATVTPTGYGTSTYSIDIQPENGEHLPDGTEVTFTIDGHTAEQKGYITKGETIRIDLSAWSSPRASPTPAAPATPTPSPSPSPTTTPTTAVWPIVGLAITCVLELLVVGGVAYITISDWSR